MNSQENSMVSTSISMNNGKVDTEATSKDIANLYSQLQSAMTRTSQDPTNQKFIPLPSSLPMSPSTSSPEESNNNDDTDTYLSRNHIDTTPLPITDSIPSVSNSSSTKPTTNTEPPLPPPSSSIDNDVSCPCHHILISKDSVHCGLCNGAMPVMEALLEERDDHEQEIKRLQQRLDEEQTCIHQQTNDISQLQTSVRQVEKQLNTKTEAFLALQTDMEMLNEKYVDEIERVAEIQHSRDMVENELEDLSRRLFEEANGMVANEKREKYNLEIAQKHLENQLKETRDRLAAEQMQLQELRLKMEAMQDFENENNSTNGGGGGDMGGYSNRNSDLSVGGNNSMEGPDVRGMKDLAGLFSDHVLDHLHHQEAERDPWPGLDTMLLDEFAELVKLRTSVPLKKLHSIPFMKHCQLEDVDPCLRFGVHSRLSARKVNEAIVMNTCFIEEAPHGFADEQAKRPVDVPLKISAGKSMIWERFSSSSSQVGVFAGCQACGRNNEASSLPYRFRISYFDDWACIDRYCRDRLVAVCEFYVFIRNVRQGYYSTRSITDLYQEALRLRLQMFYARMGALPWTIRSLGIKGDKIGSATSPQFEIPGPPLSESSPLPRNTSQVHDVNKRSGSLDEIPRVDLKTSSNNTKDDESSSSATSTTPVEVASDKNDDEKRDDHNTPTIDKKGEDTSALNTDGKIKPGDTNTDGDDGRDVFLDATDE
ncbi:unnamed protein product [Absidia cylindrospora]